MRAGVGPCDHKKRTVCFSCYSFEARSRSFFYRGISRRGKGHATEATQLMAGLGIRALYSKPEEPAFPPHGDSNERQPGPPAPVDDAEVGREQAPCRG